MRCVLKCVSLAELSVYVKLSLLAGLTISISPSVFDHQPCNSNSISFVVLSQGFQIMWVRQRVLLSACYSSDAILCWGWAGILQVIREICVLVPQVCISSFKKNNYLLCFTHFTGLS